MLKTRNKPNRTSLAVINLKNSPDINSIEFDLIENGLDFVLSSLNPIVKSTNQHDLKYSILHLSAGTELILKERLRREHWTLIFNKTDSANLNGLKSGDFQSVNLDNLLNRLENICEIQFEDSEKKYLKELKKRRNRIEHFEFKENDTAIKSLTSKVLSVIFTFIQEHFPRDTLTKNSQNQITELRKKIADFDEFTEFRLIQISKVIEKESKDHHIIECPACYQHAFVLKDKLTCLFCGYSDDPETVAIEYIENILDINAYYEIKSGGYFPLEECFECEEETMVDNREDFICFSCHSKWSRADVLECGGCADLFLRDEDTFMNICDACMRHRIEKF